MMGETASLPLPSAAPAATALVATTATTGATTSRGGAGIAQEEAGTSATDASLLFDLLLGEQPETAAMSLAGALPAATRAAAGERQEETPAADPLLTVLAQMPQTAQVAALPVTPLTPAAPAANAAAAVAPDAGSQSPAALAANRQGLGPGLAAPDIAAPAPAITSFPASGLPAETASEIGLPAAHVARFPLSQQGFATPIAAADGPLPGFAASAAEHVSSPIEPLAPTSTAPLNAVQAMAVTQPAFAPAAPVATPVLSQPADPANGYDDGFSGHVAWLAGQRIGHAEIRVVPEHLGAIDIRLQLDGSNVRAEFHSSQPEVRQALEASLPRLREMLGQHGMQLAHAGVGQGQSGQRQSGDGMPQPGHSGGLAMPDDAGSPLPPDFRRARGLLDVYA